MSWTCMTPPRVRLASPLPGTYSRGRRDGVVRPGGACVHHRSGGGAAPAESQRDAGERVEPGLVAEPVEAVGHDAEAGEGEPDHRDADEAGEDQPPRAVHERERAGDGEV